jgi:hypothetical protein
MTVQTVDKTQAKTAEFKIFSGALTPFSGTDGKLRLRTIASSSVVDLGGDEVTLNALNSMAASAKGMTVFRNHSYNVPRDILGSVEEASVKQAGTDGNGKPIYELGMGIVVFDQNPENVQTHSAIQSGVKLGTSIGAMIPPDSATKNTSGGYTFNDLRLLEASIVGIPQNPRSFVEYATKAYKAAIEDEGEAEDTNAGFHADAEPDTEKAKVWVSHNGKGEHSVVVDTDAPVDDMEATPAKSKSKSKKAAEPDITKDTEGDAEAEDVADTSEPEDFEDKPEDKPDAEADVNLISTPLEVDQKDIIPDISASIESVESSDSTSPVTSDPAEPVTEEDAAQELEKSAPESDGEASAEEEVSLSDTMTRSAETLADMLKATTREMVELRKERDAASEALRAAQAERDDIQANLDFAKKIVLDIANAPLGRKAVFHAKVEAFDQKFAGIYSPEVLKKME